VEVEWDEGKARANLRKHGIDFSDAFLVLFDELAVTIDDDRAGEERFTVIGAAPTGELFVVVCAWRGRRVRVISARRPTRRERRRYGEGA
jgi:uncharacterized DUF497 family protein